MSNITISKKIYIPIAIALLITLVAGLWVSTPALAQGNSAPKAFIRPLTTLGKVIQISNSQLTIQRRDGSQEIFLIDANTRFTDRDKAKLAFKDLDMDRWVIVGAPRMSEGERTARVVILLAENFNPEVVVGERGAITNVNTSAQNFTLRNRRGEDFTFTVNAQTVFKGGLTGLAGLKDGMTVAVSGDKLNNGNLQAQVVRGFETRVGGRVTSVDANSFTIQGRDGKQYSFQIASDTVFRKRGGATESFGNLKTGMRVLVGAKDLGNGNFQAQVVVFAR